MVGFVAKERIITQLDAWSLLPKEQAVTELFFTNSQSLAQHYKPGEKISIDYTIRNTSQQQKTYDVQVLQAGEQQPIATLIAEQQVQLAGGETLAINREVTLKDTGDKTSVSIILKGHPQNINVWLTKKQGE